jgi:hypothetical protein
MSQGHSGSSERLLRLCIQWRFKVREELIYGQADIDIHTLQENGTAVVELNDDDPDAIEILLIYLYSKPAYDDLNALYKNLWFLEG